MHGNSLLLKLSYSSFLYISVDGLTSIICRIFSPEAACEVIEAERHSHVFYQAEPDIWMVMVRNGFFYFLTEEAFNC